jgi:hypothetical protein
MHRANEAPGRSAVVEHIKHTRRSMKFSNTHRLARVNVYMDSLVKEAIEI